MISTYVHGEHPSVLQPVTDGEEVVPGTWVTRRGRTWFGIVVAREGNVVTVLWSIRRAHMTFNVGDVMTVQPMKMPAGAIFYLDYTYDEEP